MSPREQEQSCAAWTLMGGSEVLAEYDAFQNSEYGEAISAFSDQGTDLTGEHDRAFLDLLDKNC